MSMHATETRSDTARPRRRRWYGGVGVQVLVAMVCGVVVGFAFPQFAGKLKVIADTFLSLVRVGIAPLIFVTIVGGITSARSLKTTGKVAGGALIYFEVVSTIALFVGMLSANLFQIGRHVGALTTHGSGKVPTGGSGGGGFAAFLTQLIPDNFFGAFTSGNMLPVVVLAVLFGVGILSLKGQVREKVDAGIDVISQVFFCFINLVIRLAPLGAFGAIAFAVGTNGTRLLVALGELIVQYWLTVAVFIAVALGGIGVLFGINLLRVIRFARTELAVVFATSSSEPAIPGLLEKLPRLGLPRELVGIVVPTGFAFNLDGNSMYMAVCTLFLANAYGVPLSIPQQLGLLLVMLLTSKGAATVNGGAFVALAATVTAAGNIPAAGLPVLFGVFQFMSRATAICNTLGNIMATLVIARMTKSTQRAELRSRLAAADLDTPRSVRETTEEVPTELAPAGAGGHASADAGG